MLVRVSGDVNLPVLVEQGSLEGFDPKMRAILPYVEKLTLRLESMEEADLGPLREAGLSDEDILDVVMITGYFNHMNRIVRGLGVGLTREQIKRQEEILQERQCENA
ncbi:hypothetical protein ACFLQ0_05350 [Nitrospinota bacterium]